MLVIAQESTTAVSTVAYSLGLRGHVTHIQLPLEMFHNAEIQSVSVNGSNTPTSDSSADKTVMPPQRARYCDVLPWVSRPTVTSTIPSLARQFVPNHKRRKKKRKKKQKCSGGSAHVRSRDLHTEQAQ